MLNFARLPSQYDSHYAGTHRHQCGICSWQFSSQRLLEIHVAEHHDSYFSVVAARQPSYVCLVYGCLSLFVNAKERKKHLVDAHHFPKHVSFYKSKKTKPEGNDQELFKSSEATIDKLSPSKLFQSKISFKDKEITGDRITQPRHKRGSRRCIFFNSKKGCRSGSSCPFLHTMGTGNLAALVAETGESGIAVCMTIEDNTSASCAECTQMDKESQRQLPAVEKEVTLGISCTDDEMQLDSVVQSMSSLSVKVPSHISFGRRGRRRGRS